MSAVIDSERINAIWAATDAADWEAVLAGWNALDPDLRARDAGLHVAAALGLRRLARFDEADALLREGIERFPDFPQLWIDRGWLELERRDWATALERWHAAATKAPDHPGVQQGLSTALRELGRYLEADEVLRESIERSPEDIERRYDAAQVAMELRDWPLAAERYRQLALVDDAPRALVGQAEALFHQRRYAEADTMLAAALERHPDDVDLHRSHAYCALQQDRHEDALRRWQTAHVRFPEDIGSIVGLIRALIEAGDFAVARRWLALELPRHPQDRGLREVDAHLATRTGEWPQAVSAWQSLVNDFPQELALRSALMDAQFQARVASFDATGEPPRFEQEPPGSPLPARSRMAEIVWEFESLGENCDFGLLQRYYEAEPLGLLRWAGTLPEQIVPAAQARFDGVGEPENTVIDVWPNGEYSVSDRRFNMLMHSFTYETVVDRDSFTQQQIKRGRYLKRKLLEDIEGGTKILMYKSESMSDAQAQELNRALKAIGPAWLVVARLADAQHPNGTLEEVEPGFLCGYLERFPNFQTPPTEEMVAGWAALCEQAFDRWKAAVPTRDAA